MPQKARGWDPRQVTKIHTPLCVPEPKDAHDAPGPWSPPATAALRISRGAVQAASLPPFRLLPDCVPRKREEGG